MDALHDRFDDLNLYADEHELPVWRSSAPTAEPAVDNWWEEPCPSAADWDGKGKDPTMRCTPHEMWDAWSLGEVRDGLLGDQSPTPHLVLSLTPHRIEAMNTPGEERLVLFCSWVPLREGAARKRAAKASSETDYSCARVARARAEGRRGCGLRGGGAGG